MLVGASQATKCYVCSSTTDPACNDPYEGDSKHEVDCIGEKEGCSKHKAVGKVIGLDFSERKSYLLAMCDEFHLLCKIEN